MKTTHASRPLNARQQRFCEYIAAGHSQTEAWLKAGYQVSRGVARRNAAESMTKPDIAARVAELRKPQTEAAKMSKEEKLAFLASIVRTPISRIDPDSSLCQESTEETIVGGLRGKLSRGDSPEGNKIVGPTVIRRRIKMCDKLRALELHSKLVGDFEPERVEVDSGEKTLAAIMERAKTLAGLAIKVGKPAAPPNQKGTP